MGAYKVGDIIVKDGWQTMKCIATNETDEDDIAIFAAYFNYTIVNGDSRKGINPGKLKMIDNTKLHDTYQFIKP